MQQLKILGVFVLAVFAVWLAIKSGQTSQPQASSSNEWMEVLTKEQQAKSVAPDFTLPEVGTGKMVHFADEVREQPVVLIFSSLEFQPFVDNLPMFEDICSKYKGRVKFFGIIGETDPHYTLDFARRHKINFPFLNDTKEVSVAYRVPGSQFVAVVDTAGHMRATVTGGTPDFEADFGKFLDQILAEKPTK